MDKEHIPKKIFDVRFYNIRLRGRPRNQWKDAVERTPNNYWESGFGGEKQKTGMEAKIKED